MAFILVISRDSSVATLASAAEEFGGEVKTVRRQTLPANRLGEILSQGDGPHTIMEVVCDRDPTGFTMLMTSVHLRCRVYDPAFASRISSCLFEHHNQIDEERLCVDLSTALVRHHRN